MSEGSRRRGGRGGQRYYLYDSELRRPSVSSSTPLYNYFQSSSSPTASHHHYHSNPHHMKTTNHSHNSTNSRKEKYEFLVPRDYSHPHYDYYSSSSSKRIESPTSRRRKRGLSHYSRNQEDEDSEKEDGSERIKQHSRTRSPPSRPASSSPLQSGSEKKEKEYDLSIELEPLTHYVSDPRRLLKEAMILLGQKRLTAMIPPTLKSMGRRNLEFFCLEELEALDPTTLLNILEGKGGKELNQIPNKEIPQENTKTVESTLNSGGDTSSGQIAVKKFKNKLKKILIQETEKSSHSKRHKRKKKREKSENLDDDDDDYKMEEDDKIEIDKNEDGKKIKKIKIKKSKKKRKKHKGDDDDDNNDDDKNIKDKHRSTTGVKLPGQKTLMELLELEYRAKAIKALLRTQGLDASKIDNALSLDPPPPISSLSSSSLEHKLNQNIIPESILPPLSPTMRSPDSSNINIISEIIILSSPHHSICSSQGKLEFTKDIISDEDVVGSCHTLSPQHHVTSTFPNIDDEESSHVDESMKGDCEETIIEDEDYSENEFVVQVPSLLPKSPPSIPPIPKEFEDGEIDSDIEVEEDNVVNAAGAGDGNLSLVGGIDDIYGDSSEEETGIWSKRVCLTNNKSDSSSSSSSCESDNNFHKRRSWARDRKIKISQGQKRSYNHIDGRESEILSDVSLVDLEDDSEIDEYKDKYKDKSKGKDEEEENKNKSVIGQQSTNIKKSNEEIEDIDSLPDDILERISSDGEDHKENENDNDFDTLPIIKDNKSIGDSDDDEHTIGNEDDDDEIENKRSDDDIENEDEEDTPLTWYHRWYKSKKIQNVVKTNKMYGSLRNKLRQDKPNKKGHTNITSTSTTTTISCGSSSQDIQIQDSMIESEISIPIIGSIEEYEKLFGKKSMEIEQDQEKQQQGESSKKEQVIFSGNNINKIEMIVCKDKDEDADDDDDDDDDEDDDLWGDILGQNS